MVAQGLYFLPLGGAGEIGMNLNLYALDGYWLMVDLGVTFRDEMAPGTEIITPDPEFILNRLESLVGLVLTHGHEDHIGAVPYLWRELRCPLYATHFTAALLRRKLKEVGLEDEAVITEIPLKGQFSIDPFDLELVTLTHSIPEPNALVIKTAYGTVFHTGDWKIDPEPLIGEEVDEKRLCDLGDEGVLAVIGDSTNALVAGEAGSEGQVYKSLTTLIGSLSGQIVVALFASNIARMRSVALAARDNGRQCILSGRSLWRMNEAARECGYLSDIPHFLSEKEGANLPSDKIILICTGSQGESRAALSKLSRQAHPHLSLQKGGTVIFSSRVIPGNEMAIGAMQNRLSRLGLRIITPNKETPIHVSGHPARDELTRLYHWLKPQILVPVHGEHRHMRAHAELGRETQVKQTMVIENGQLLHLTSKGANPVDQVYTGRLALDGNRLVPGDGIVLRDRLRLSMSGIIFVTLVLDKAGALEPPTLSLTGILEDFESEELIEDLQNVLIAALRSFLNTKMQNDKAIIQTVQKTIRTFLHKEIGKKPLCEIHLIRL